jgi:hypothetical protein
MAMMQTYPFIRLCLLTFTSNALTETWSELIASTDPFRAVSTEPLGTCVDLRRKKARQTRNSSSTTLALTPHS